MTAELTDSVLATLRGQLKQPDTLGAWQKPWHAIGPDCMPLDPTNGREFGDEDWSGLWDAQMIRGYRTNYWTSRRRWHRGGGLVRQGERGLPLSPPPGSQWQRRRLVFNADQQDGFRLPHLQRCAPLFAPDARLDAVFARTGISVNERGGSARYFPGDDLIVMPERRLFVGNDCLSAKEAWYAALAHEHIHATGHTSRLGRDMTAYSGTLAGAFEDLIAEIGAALLMAAFGMPTYRTLHHARYLAAKMQRIRDPRHDLHAAAAEAERAAAWIVVPP